MARNLVSRIGTGKVRNRGLRAERFAASYLQRRGLKLIARNWHCARGEIDLVCIEGETIVFVEVKQRQCGALVSAGESISAGKLRRLGAAANSWIARYDPAGKLGARIDLVAINGIPADSNTHWIKSLSMGGETDNG